MTKEGDLVSVFVFVFLFTARMPLVTRIGDLDSVFVFGFVTARMPLVTRAGGSVSVNDNPRGSIWTGLARDYLFVESLRRLL